MLKNQKGFGHIGAILALVVIVLVSLSGWFVWNNNQKSIKATDQPSMPRHDVQKDDAASDEKPYSIPAGYTAYEDKQKGFTFAYPAYWGALSPKTQADTHLVAATADIILSSDTNIGGAFEVYNAPIATFTQPAIYHGVDVRPEKSKDGYRWIVASVNPDFSEYSVGEEFTEAKIVFQKDDVHVYEFAMGHADGQWSWLVFASGASFTGMKLPYVYPYDTDPDGGNFREDFASIDIYASVVKEVAKTIRLLRD